MSIDAVTIIYLVQISFLCACIYMTWTARKSLNGLGRGLILLFLLLIVRRINDVLNYLDTVGTLVLSSAVVVVVTYDIYQIYRARDIYALYFRNRQARIEELEALRDKSEAGMNWDTKL